MSETLKRYRMKFWLYLCLFIGSIGLSGTAIHDWLGRKTVRAMDALVQQRLRKHPELARCRA